MTDQIPIKDHFAYLCGIKGDKSEMYGVYCFSLDKFNLNGNKPNGKLTAKDPITITYNKKERTVKFTSKNFDYS